MMDGMDYFKFAKYLLFLPVLLMTVIVSKSTLFPFIVGKYVFFRTVVGVAFLFFLLGLLFDTVRGNMLLERLKKIAKIPLFISIAAFVVIFLLAGIFGVDPMNSFWSNFERGEGGLQILTFFLYFSLLTILFEKREDWNALFWCAIIGGSLMGVYGYLAASGAAGFVGSKFSEGGFRFQGSIGNPAYVAIYALFLIFYSVYLFLQQRKAKILSLRALGFGLLIAFFLSIFFLAATRGSFIGLGVAGLVGLLFIGFSYKKFRIKMIGFIVLLILFFSVGIYFKDSSFIKSMPAGRLFDISFSTKTFSDRTTIWKMAWDGFKERPLLGWGPENFIQVFDKHFNPDYFKPAEGFGAWFDRAHSVIFDYLVETGILGFLAYVAMFVSFYIGFFRLAKKEKNETKSFSLILERALLLAIPIGYLVQGLVLFDISVTYLNLFTIFAFAMFYFYHGDYLHEKGDQKKMKHHA